MAVSTSSVGLVSSDVSAVPKGGQPVLQTSEPCGKRSFVGGRFAFIFAVVRALRHCLLRPETIAENENDARHPLKAARTILSEFNQVKIASQLIKSLI